ncbi:MAG: T9SS type A sorting domain-containing protein [Bacteroidetes bacterium]|nr:T9SS type A sorting domain-containing protein [Bacteroidota bacterium]
MKKLVLFIAVLFSCSITALNAQVIENFEPIQMNLFSGGTNGGLSVIANPDMNVNETMYVGQMDRGFDGDPWAGWYADIDEAITVDVGTNQYVHLMLWKPRISPIVFKYENPDAGTTTGDVNPMTTQMLTDEWEEFVFDMSVVPGDYTRIVLIPDFENPLTLTEDITLYFDQMYVNDDPTPGSEPVMILEDFEPIPMTLFSAGTNGALEVVANPDPEGNLTNRVAKMTRGFDGDPWAGVFADTDEPIDPAVTPYIHVMVWKPRISPVVFKLENPGTGGNTGDVTPMEAQSMENGWENLVFDFSSFAGEEFTRIVLLPDFEDPLTLTEDIVIYFDEIMKSDQASMEGNVTLNLNMEGAIGYNSMVVFDPELHDVFVAGDPWGWPQPGTDPSLMLTSEDGINYTGTFFIEDGRWQWKYFFVPKGESSWDHGEWDGTENRHHIIMGEVTLDQVWGDKPVDFTFNVDMENADPFDPATDDVYIAGELLSDWNQPGTVEDYKLEPVEGKAMMYTITLPLYIGEHQYKYFRVINEEPSWDNGEWEGGDNRMVAVDTNMVEVFDVWGSPEAIFEYQPITFNMYPNPAGNQLTIDKLDAANMIEVYNVIGEKVISLDNIQNEKVTINTSELTEGVYLITVYTEKGVQSTKFLKK